MKIAETEIPGVLTVDAEPREDARGAFARTFCAAELAAAGALGFVPAQANISRNAAARTLRGMHYQAPPRAEAKLVQVTRGAVFDVVVDLRPESPT
ncbi:MAG: dTDP-4-dehydrorhamnose 3,5-epimerase family protein, partial [Pseudomonadota bacterium]